MNVNARPDARLAQKRRLESSRGCLHLPVGRLHWYRPALASHRLQLAPPRLQPLAVLPFLRGTSNSSETSPIQDHPQQPQQQPHFDLPLAVVLAGAAFESYLQPQIEHAFQQRSVSGPTVTFTDQSFLTEVYSGVLVVDLQGAANLRVADVTGSSDPYAVLSLGPTSYRSPTQSACLNPTWNEKYCFYVKDAASDVLRIRLYDEDLVKSDDELGTAMVGLSVLADKQGGKETFTLPLRGSGAGSGATLTLRCRLLSFADADPRDIAAMTSSVTTAPSPSALAGLQAAAAAVAAAVPERIEAAFGAVLPAQLSLPAAGEKVEGATPANGADDPPTPASTAGPLDAEVATVELPDGEQVANPWRVLSRMVGRAVGVDALTPVAFVESEETDTQVWLYRAVEAREAVLAFRGTEQVKWKDIATDLNLTPCSLNPERVDDNSGLPFTARLIRAMSGVNQDQMMVHKGFLDAYDSVKRVVFSLLDEITGSGEKGGPWRVLITGHSLGGALATLAAYELAERRTSARSVQSMSLYTFGAPRVGNKAFAEAFDRVVPDTWRVTNSNDIIPSVPRLMGYCHVGHAVRLSGEGALRIGRSSAESTDAFGEGKAGMEVIQAIVSQVSEQARPWDEVYSEIAERELLLLDTLVGGRGLEEHMETFYLASLQQAVAASEAEARQKQQQQE